MFGKISLWNLNFYIYFRCWYYFILTADYYLYHTLDRVFPLIIGYICWICYICLHLYSEKLLYVVTIMIYKGCSCTLLLPKLSHPCLYHSMSIDVSVLQFIYRSVFITLPQPHMVQHMLWSTYKKCKVTGLSVTLPPNPKPKAKICSYCNLDDFHVTTATHDKVIFNDKATLSTFTH